MPAGSGIILEGYIFGVKQYILRIKDKNGKLFDKSAWAGIPRNSLSLEQAVKLSKGISISKDIYKVVSKNNKVLSNVPIKNENKAGIEKLFINNKLFPNSIFLKNYGFLISKDFEINNLKGDLYHYRKDIYILIQDI